MKQTASKFSKHNFLYSNVFVKLLNAAETLRIYFHIK